MAEGFRKYFDREYYRRIDKKFAIRPIVYCWWFNFIIALVVFNTSMYLFGNMFITIMHTMLAWTVTLTISIIYWLFWTQKNMKGGRNVKIVASSAILIMFVIALLFIIRVLGMLVRAAG